MVIGHPVSPEPKNNCDKCREQFQIVCSLYLPDEELDDLELPVVRGEVERGAAVHGGVHVEPGGGRQLAHAVCGRTWIA